MLLLVKVPTPASTSDVVTTRVAIMDDANAKAATVGTPTASARCLEVGDSFNTAILSIPCLECAFFKSLVLK